MTLTALHRWIALYWAFAWRAALMCLGLMLLFYLVAAPIEALLRVPRLKATLFDLGMLLLLALLGMCLALQWCSRARFGEYRLRVEPGRIIGLRFGQALCVVWAQAWRGIVVAVPVLLMARFALSPLLRQAHLWLGDELLSLLIFAAIGFWALREAIAVRYSGFSLRWTHEPTATSVAITAQH